MKSVGRVQIGYRRSGVFATWVVCAALAMVGIHQGRAADWTYATSGGNWGTAGNWNAAIPNSNTAEANFNKLNIAGQNTVHLNGSYQVNRLLFGDTGSLYFGWVLDNNGTEGNTLTLSGATPYIQVNNSITAQISAKLVSSGAFTKTGNGTLVLSNAANSGVVIGEPITGGLQLDDGTYTTVGTLKVGSSSGHGTLTLNGDSTLTLGTATSDLLTVNGNMTDRIGTINISDNAEVNVGRNLRAGADGGATSATRSSGIINQYGGAVTVGNLFVVRNSGDTAYGTGEYYMTGGTLSTAEFRLHQAQQNGAVVEAAIGGTGVFTATAGVNFVQSASGATETTARLTMNVGGTLRTTRILGTADTTYGKMVLDLSGGKIVALENNAAFISGLTVAPTIGAAGITFDSNGYNISIGQAMQGAAGKLTKIGAGTLTLSGDNTYGGETLVSEGTLNINGTTGAGMITVNSGAILGGSGTISGATTISGTHTPGNSPGLQTFEAGLTYESGATLKWELTGNTLGTRGSDFDGIDVSGGDLSINSGATLSLAFNEAESSVDWADEFWDENRTWLVIDHWGAGNSAGNFGTVNVSVDSNAQTLASVRAGASFSSTSDGGDIYVSYIVPEPATAGMLLIGMVGMALRRRQKIQRQA